MKVLIATKNPAKIEGARLALSKYFNNFEINGINVESNVSNQPVNNEIYLGAKNRVNNLIKYAQQNNLNADLFLAIEAGISNSLGNWCNFNIAVIKDNKGNEAFGVGPAFPIPEKYIEEIKQKSLGIFMDNLFNENNLSKGEGGIGLLSKGEMSRIQITKDAFIMALTQIINNFWGN